MACWILCGPFRWSMYWRNRKKITQRGFIWANAHYKYALVSSPLFADEFYEANVQDTMTQFGTFITMLQRLHLGQVLLSRYDSVAKLVNSSAEMSLI